MDTSGLKPQVSLPLLPHRLKQKAPKLSTGLNSTLNQGEKQLKKNYLSLYSSSKSNPKTRNPREPKDQDLKTEDLGNSKIIIKNFKTINLANNLPGTIHNEVLESNHNLRKKEAKLLYEIQKARSDKLEIMRDLATYDYNFDRKYNLKPVLYRIKEITEVINDVQYHSTFCPVVDPADLGCYKALGASPETEDFSIKYQAPHKTKETLMQGSFIISNIPCIVNICGTKWLENLEIRLITTSRQVFQYSLNFKTFTIYKDKKNLTEILNSMLSKFYFEIADKGRLSLIYNTLHFEKFIVAILAVRGYGKCSVMFTVDNSRLNIHVLEQKEVLEVPMDVANVKSLKEITVSKLKKIVIDCVYYDKYTKEFYWQEEKNLNTIYYSRESCSKYLNEEYLREALNNKSFKVIYKFDLVLGSHVFFIEMHAFKDQIYLQARCESEIIEIPQESKYFKFLSDLQVINLFSSPSTLGKSLEIQVIVKKQFPRLFISKLK